MIDHSTVDRIFAAANIVDVISDFITLKKKGVNYNACCPFHNEKTPSFVVSPAKGLFKCFGCGKGGNAVTFVMEHESMSYVEALKYVAHKYNIEVEEKEETEEQKRKNDDRESLMAVTNYGSQYFIEQLHKTSEGQNVGLSYFRERGFSDQTIVKFGLGFCPTGGDTFTRAALKDGYKEQFLVDSGLSIKRDEGGFYDRFWGRVMFPIHGISGRVTGFGGRTLRTDKKVAKYLNSPESEIYHKSSILYGLFFAKKAITRADSCILVEGYTDVISMHQAGIENVVASSGTSLTEDQIRLISRFTKNITIIYDGDAAGIKASLRGINLILAQGLNVRIVPLPVEHDPDSFARAHTTVELEEYILSNTEDFMSFKTKLLLDDSKGDPLKKASVVSDIVESISLIPDGITRSVYISECAKLLEISEDVLVREVGGRMAKRSDGDQGYQAYRNAIKKQENKQLANDITRKDVSAGSSCDELEKEIVKYLLRYGDQQFKYIEDNQVFELNVAQTLIDEISQHEVSLQNPTFRIIFDTYQQELEQRSEQQEQEEQELEPSSVSIPMHIFTNHTDPEVCSVAVDLLTSDDVYIPSRLWDRYDILVDSESDRLSIAIPRVIKLYKSKAIELLIAHLMEQMDNLSAQLETAEQQGDDDPSTQQQRQQMQEELKGLTSKISALNRERIAISKQLSRLIL
ncbi:MAG: DNA primase [Rikenellaceae bacterium]